MLVHRRIALPAALAPEVYKRMYLGDRFLIATARVKMVPIVTWDEAMRDLGADWPGYLTVIVC